MDQSLDRTVDNATQWAGCESLNDSVHNIPFNERQALLSEAINIPECP
jgi:hypothetical protein